MILNLFIPLHISKNNISVRASVKSYFFELATEFSENFSKNVL
jgi:hypothetical protein